MNSSNCVTCSPCITGEAAITFFHCRGSGPPAYQTFTISSCPDGQVIIIRSAEVGYNRLWDPNTNPQTCSWETASCRRSVANNAAIMRCNRQPSCSFSGAIFVYPRGSMLCNPPRDGNYIDIKYDCITGT